MKEVLKLALEALETYKGFIDDAHIIEGQWHWIDGLDNVQTAIKEALAKDEKGLFIDLIAQHEGLAEELAHPSVSVEQEPKTYALLYPQADYVATPDERPWLGLTDEEWESMYDKFAKYQEYGAFVSGWDNFARAIEAALKEKNT